MNIKLVEQDLNQMNSVKSVKEEIENAEARLNAVFSRISSRTVDAAKEATKDNPLSGIPDDVASQIREKAKKDWPNDYDLQICQIQLQAKSWKKLNQP